VVVAREFDSLDMEAGMQVYEGEIGVVGRIGHSGRTPGHGRMMLSVLEIGDQQLRRIAVPELLAAHLRAGQRSRVLVGQGLSHGLITRPFVAAVEVQGRKYKVDRPLLVVLLKTLAYSALVLPLFVVAWPLGLLLCLAIAGWYLRDYFDLRRF
jgi:hypothetical protein